MLDAVGKTAQLRKPHQAPAVVVAAVTFARPVDFEMSAVVRTEYDAFAAALLLDQDFLDEIDHIHLAEKVRFRFVEEPFANVADIAQMAEVYA